jgi:hypothetical protein
MKYESHNVTVVERLGTCLQSRVTWVQIPPVTLVYVGVDEGRRHRTANPAGESRIVGSSPTANSGGMAMLHLKNYIDLPKEDTGWKIGYMPPYPLHLGLLFFDESKALFVLVSVETVPNPYCPVLMTLGGKPYLHVTLYKKGGREEVMDDDLQAVSKTILRGKMLIAYEIPVWLKEAARKRAEADMGKLPDDYPQIKTKHCCVLVETKEA